MESSVALARLKQDRGDIAAAFAVLDGIESDSPMTKAMVSTQRVRLYLANSYVHPGALKEALRWAEGHILRPVDPSWQTLETLTLARVMIAGCRQAAQYANIHLPDLKELVKFLDEQIRNAQTADWVERLAELCLLKALAWQAQNCLPEAQEFLFQALEAAEPGGYIRLFLDEGIPVRRLMARLKVDDRRIAEYVRRILVAGGMTEASSLPPTSAQHLIEPLSARELEVLHLLVEGASNAEIARRLVIGLETAKNTSPIFSKNCRPRQAMLTAGIRLAPPSIRSDRESPLQYQPAGDVFTPVFRTPVHLLKNIYYCLLEKRALQKALEWIIILINPGSTGQPLIRSSSRGGWMPTGRNGSTA